MSSWRDGSSLVQGTDTPRLWLRRAEESDLVPYCQRIYGDARIEDMWLPFFCVSSNLSRGELMVHSEGLLWQAIRATQAQGVAQQQRDAANRFGMEAQAARNAGSVERSRVSLRSSPSSDFRPQGAPSTARSAPTTV